MSSSLRGEDEASDNLFDLFVLDDYHFGSNTVSEHPPPLPFRDLHWNSDSEHWILDTTHPSELDISPVRSELLIQRHIC